jgi:hypothetical protein
MDASIAWVKPPSPKQGLDHLGSQAPCIALYTILIPGITNVTDRVRYYSIYPWIVQALEKSGLAADIGKFTEYFRRSECLLTLISERHQRQCQANDHGDAMVGRFALLPALDDLERGIALNLSTYSTTEDGVSTRYFKNRLGGLGQYYLGSLHDLGILDYSEKPWVRYTKQLGEPLANAVNSRVDGRLFVETLKNDRVTLKRLDELSSFCFCQLHADSNEKRLLVELLFQAKKDTDEGSENRKKSFGLLLSWIDKGDKQTFGRDRVGALRSSLYSWGADKPGAWEIPPSLRAIAEGWRLYERNDLLSVAVQAIFFAVLHKLRWTDRLPRTIAELRVWLATQPEVKGLSKKLGGTWRDAARKIADKAPPRIDWQASGHEESLRERLAAEFKADHGIQDRIGTILELALRVLLLLSIRPTDVKGYSSCPLPTGYLIDYPVNLARFDDAVEEWRSMKLEEVVVLLATRWGIETHLRIALRKLRVDSKSTFQITPTERELVVTEPILAPASTTPRMRQALRMLEDLSLVEPSGDALILTQEGKRVLKDAIGA